MATRLDKTIKRELELDGRLYTVSVSPQGIKVVLKGGRKGHEITWDDLLSGAVELRRDLNMSLGVYPAILPRAEDLAVGRQM